MVGSRHRFQRGLRSWLFEIALVLVRFGSHCQRHRKRESRHHVNGCCALRSRLHYPACHTTADRVVARRKLDRRRVYLCVVDFVSVHENNQQLASAFGPEGFVCACPLLLSTRERMAAEFATKCVANLGDDLDLRGMVIFRVFELMDRVLVIDGVRWKMDEIARIVAQQSGAD